MDHKAATAELIKIACKRGLRTDTGEVEKLHTILQLGADPNALINKREPILLRFLNTSHDERCIQVLLDHGADPNLSRRLSEREYKRGKGETPLAGAVNTAWRAHALLWTRQLLKAGAEVNRWDSHGYTALDHLLFHMMSLSSHVLKNLEQPFDDMTTCGVIQIFFDGVEPLLECAEELLLHGAEGTSAKDPVPEILNQVKALWNRCVEWEEKYRATLPDDFDIFAPV